MYSNSDAILNVFTHASEHVFSDVSLGQAGPDPFRKRGWGKVETCYALWKALLVIAVGVGCRSLSNRFRHIRYNIVTQLHFFWFRRPKVLVSIE